MAISLTAAAVPCVKSEQCISSSASAKLSALSSLQLRFPANSGKIGISTPRIAVSSRARNATVV
ncbi:hypothetical protein CRG98_047223, partial [Punica granatum]